MDAVHVCYWQNKTRQVLDSWVKHITYVIKETKEYAQVNERE